MATRFDITTPHATELLVAGLEERLRSELNRRLRTAADDVFRTFVAEQEKIAEKATRELVASIQAYKNVASLDAELVVNVKLTGVKPDGN